MASLNDEIVAYLTINNISFTAGDFQTGQPEGQEDQVLHWDSEKLRTQPLKIQLEAAYSIWQEQQVQLKNKSQAQALLQATDWATLSDITSGTHRLTNQDAFIAYRNELRAIAVNPPTTPATFPSVPTETWGS
jgi:hypothetical protein